MDASYLVGLSSAGERAAPSSSEPTDAHAAFRRSLPDSALACRRNQRGHPSRAIRAENKDGGGRRTKGSRGDQKAVMKGD